MRSHKGAKLPDDFQHGGFARADVAPENDTKQEDNESYEKARQLLNQIPHEKNSKVLLEKEQDIESYHQEKKQNPPPSNTKIEEQQNKLDYQEDTQNLQQDSADTKEQRNKLQQGSIQNLQQDNGGKNPHLLTIIGLYLPVKRD